MLLCNSLSAQQNDNRNTFSESSMIVGIGFGASSGIKESGLGLNYLLGWQQKIGKNKKIEINPYVTFGTYKAFAIPTDTPEQFLKSTNLGFDTHFHVSRVINLSVGTFGNYTRGMYSDDGYFTEFYWGGKASIGFKKQSKWNQLSYEVRPVTVLFGSDFLQLYFSYLMKIKLKKK